ncbi:Cd(II)/Pb(II)-responsive transcriptional regulator [Vitreoscilla massiliensis]|uniref:Cd(II)/Pb(II)-responsive transcriptional regulator n=1 Tax=Vitreoscilla massiliensis TaxID=1689272 RepID=A0ABY4DYG5_9NEIS|nr:Cd(II)/Pb(II)-responsive transcriptional regulator [Vitreoscilla massiliensis]UOO88567.1 Cd(II)/Pb(II)-responsive transcriptional regulator [Vitreoscilla massiliensis]
MQVQIGELAKISDCKVVTIRYYEKEGLLPEPTRSSSNYRLYNDSHIERLQFIRHCRSLDMSLDEIKTILSLRAAPQQDCAEVNAMLDAHIVSVEERIAALQHLQQHLWDLREKCGGVKTIATCGIIQSLADGSCHSDGQPHAHG